MRTFRLLLTIVLMLAMTAVAAGRVRVPTKRQARDPRVPLLLVQTGEGQGFGTAVLISVEKQGAYYLTNRHMTPAGNNATYTLVTKDEKFEAIYIKSDRQLDLALLWAAPVKVAPLRIAIRAPPLKSAIGLYGWSYGKIFGIQEGHVLEHGNDCDCPQCRGRDWTDWIRVTPGANLGQSGGPIMHRGQVVGLIARTDGSWTLGPDAVGIRKFLGW